MSEVDGATLIARSLKQQGIDHLFGVVGFPVGPIAAAAQQEGINYIGMRNEQAASYAAQAYGYMTGRPGACLTVTGPGVVHGLAGLANAQQNCWPMILIGGASETYRGGMGAFQEERQVLIATPFCKFAHGIESVQRIPYYVEMATRHAIYGRPGATYLDMPDDIITGNRDLDKVIQLDIAPEEIGHNKATEVALVGDGKAIMAQLNKALAGRQWFHPKDTPWRQMITKKATENAAQIAPQINDDAAPANYYRALRDVAAWMPKDSILSAEGAGTMDIGLTQLPSFNARSCLNAGTYGTMGVGLGHAIAAGIVHPDRPALHLSGDSAIGVSGMEMETLVLYNFPA